MCYIVPDGPVAQQDRAAVVEIDGKFKSVYGIFVEALKAGLELKQKFPHSQIKVHEADHRRTEH